MVVLKVKQNCSLEMPDDSHHIGNFFHQPYLHGFHLKVTILLLLFAESLYIIKLCAATKSFLHIQLRVVS